jgi:hypothetical protein|tara:strand:+ start:102 stop:746 length:645 start_codon:yes stop_codon:yes gene_type:complete
MKKILVYLVATMFMAASAYAEKRLGVSLAYTMFESDGTEETKSSGEKNTGSVDEDVLVPALFFEVANDRGLAFGIDYTPADTEIGSGTGDDDDAETSGANKASAELTGHFTLYGLIPVGSNGGYLKAGVAHASIDTTENLATGTEYGNADVNGVLVGFGFNRERDNGGFFRMEGTYTDYEDVKFRGALDGDSVRNVVDADVDALAIRVAVGRAF